MHFAGSDNLTLCSLSQRNITTAVFPHFWRTYFLCIPLLHLRLIFTHYAVFITPGVFADLIKFLRARGFVVVEECGFNLLWIRRHMH